MTKTIIVQRVKDGSPQILDQFVTPGPGEIGHRHQDDHRVLRWLELDLMFCQPGTRLIGILKDVIKGQ